MLVLIFFLVIKWLSAYTDHDEFVQVPDFKGIEIKRLDQFVQGKEVSFEIIDSIYDARQQAGIVLRQDPEPNSKVKHNRTVYLYVTGMVAPQISMPKLVNRSERQARLMIETYGLKVGRVSTKSADCNGCVIAQLINGKEVEPGEAVKKGSTVSLVVGVKDNYYTPESSDTTNTGEPSFNEPE